MCYAFSDSFVFVDFEESMNHRITMPGVFASIESDTYCYFKDLYEKNVGALICEDLKIPKIIHQIWLGSELPEQYKEFQQSWLVHHPDWEYKLWTDADVSSFSFKNKELFDEARNFGQKADIWRYEILEKFGGVYIDTDFECLKPLDSLHYAFDFYAGLPALGANGVQVAIGIIGAVPHHHILQAAVALMNKTRGIGPIIVTTGPIFFTNVCKHLAGKTGMIDIILPASYFYPRTYEQPRHPMNAWRRTESFAVHHWAGSWLSKDAFEKK
jgi:inositol phosphorylceramide mannosyltransferase catalytic subunit